ncbi:RNase adapter RapZ [Rhodovarius sp.]|uniref:RNase adapter RapZ n=1 Tax=Rhodovarius sp. TaxID=2972673 RepID=UPI00333EFEA8
MTRPVVIITGLSGAGRASILNMLEDLSFETVDNPPLAVLEALLGDGDLPIAVGVDTRSRGFDPPALLKILERLRLRPDLAPTLLFATAEDAVLLRRYTETRRRHPLAPGGPFGTRVQDGIARETLLMAPLREAADLLVDTTDVPLPELRRRMEAGFRPEGAPGLSITVQSFGFPKGLPREADLVFDMRFLRNPHYVPALKPLTGRDAGVAEYVAEDAAFPAFWQNLTALLDPLLPRYVAEGKKYLTIAVGCTGGRHRSVFVAEKLAAHLAETSSMHGWRVELAHRELPEIARGSNTPHAENGHPDLLPDIAPRDTHMTTVE